MDCVPETSMDDQPAETAPARVQVEETENPLPTSPVEKRGAEAEDMEHPQKNTDTSSRAEVEVPQGGADASPRKPKPSAMAQDKAPGVMMIAASSKSKNVAGYIAQTTRESGAPPTLNCVGPASVNQAVKAIAIARKYLDGDKVDLRCLVTRSSSEDIKDLFKLQLSTAQCNQDLEDMEWIDLKSSNNSARNALAGAIANNVRSQKRPRVTCIGQLSVFRAVLAVSTARRYLKDDDIDLLVVPEFTEVEVENGQKLNAVQLIVVSQPIEQQAVE